MSIAPRQEQLAGTMFDIPEPPTGPRKMPSQPNTWVGYLAWRRTPEGTRFLGEMERRAVNMFRAGARRISVNGLHDDVRRDLKLEANNSHRPWIADDLCRRHPELMGAIERRKRRKVG